MAQNPLIPKKAKDGDNFSNPEKQSMGILDDYAVRKVVLSQVINTQDHNADGDKPEVVNVCYGTDATPPTASTVPIGTIYVQYTP